MYILTSSGIDKMKTEIAYIVNNPIDRKGQAVLVKYGNTENTISKAEVAGNITDDMMKVWGLCGLDDKQIKDIVRFLKS